MAANVSLSDSHALHTRHLDRHSVDNGHVEIHTTDNESRCFGAMYDSHPPVYPPAHHVARDVTEVEREQLRRISDRIDECMMRAARVEQHWNSSVQMILKLLAQNAESQKKSYV